MQKLWCHLTSTVVAAGTGGGGGGLVDEARENSSITLLLLMGCCCKQSTSPPTLLPNFVNPAKITFKVRHRIMKSWALYNRNINPMSIFIQKLVNLHF
jgi:hypothetical protein